MSKKFDQLASFLHSQMRMSHVYQPAMLIELLRNGGSATATDVAKAILVHDPTQVGYYETITKRYPGRVLTQNRRLTEREGDTYRLRGFEELSGAEVGELIEICAEKLNDFLKSKAADPWNHRRKASGYISGPLKYEVLKRARMRCQLCGISGEIRALEVDHIVPRKHFGSDDISNLQALCYSCNATKRDSDDTDFRSMVESYDDREVGCDLCEPPPHKLDSQDELSYSLADPFPVSTGHTLIVPRRHVADYFDLYQPELNAIQRNLEARKSSLQRADGSITGFNVGFDSGRDAGQTVLHCHLNLIPRRSEDCGFPRGGIRHAKPSWPPER